LELLNRHVSSCNVSSLKPPGAFLSRSCSFTHFNLLFFRYLLEPCQRGPSSFWANCGSWESVFGY
jgi:hypothetical protein